MKTVKVKIKKDPFFKNIKRHKVLPIFNDLIWPTLLFSLLFFFYEDDYKSNIDYSCILH